MKTIVNKTRSPIKVPLPRGKCLRLGPGSSGQIRDEDLRHVTIEKLVGEGTIEVADSTETRRDAGRSRGESSAPRRAGGR